VVGDVGLFCDALAQNTVRRVPPCVTGEFVTCAHVSVPPDTVTACAAVSMNKSRMSPVNTDDGIPGVIAPAAASTAPTLTTVGIGIGGYMRGTTVYSFPCINLLLDFRM
jgi:hypothetical protein